MGQLGLDFLGVLSGIFGVLLDSLLLLLSCYGQNLFNIVVYGTVLWVFDDGVCLYPLYSLETWYFMALILFAGYLKNAEVSVDALSIW